MKTTLVLLGLFVVTAVGLLAALIIANKAYGMTSSETWSWMVWNGKIGGFLDLSGKTWAIHSAMFSPILLYIIVFRKYFFRK